MNIDRIRSANPGLIHSCLQDGTRNKLLSNRFSAQSIDKSKPEKTEPSFYDNAVRLAKIATVAIASAGFGIAAYKILFGTHTPLDIASKYALKWGVGGMKNDEIGSVGLAKRREKEAVSCDFVRFFAGPIPKISSFPIAPPPPPVNGYNITLQNQTDGSYVKPNVGDLIENNLDPSANQTYHKYARTEEPSKNRISQNTTHNKIDNEKLNSESYQTSPPLNINSADFGTCIPFFLEGNNKLNQGFKCVLISAASRGVFNYIANFRDVLIYKAKKPLIQLDRFLRDNVNNNFADGIELTLKSAILTVMTVFAEKIISRNGRVLEHQSHVGDIHYQPKPRVLQHQSHVGDIHYQPKNGEDLHCQLAVHKFKAHSLISDPKWAVHLEGSRYNLGNLLKFFLRNSTLHYPNRDNDTHIKPLSEEDINLLTGLIGINKEKFTQIWTLEQMNVTHVDIKYQNILRYTYRCFALSQLLLQEGTDFSRTLLHFLEKNDSYWLPRLFAKTFPEFPFYKVTITPEWQEVWRAHLVTQIPQHDQLPPAQNWRGIFGLRW